MSVSGKGMHILWFSNGKSNHHFHFKLKYIHSPNTYQLWLKTWPRFNYIYKKQGWMKTIPPPPKVPTGMLRSTFHWCQIIYGQCQILSPPEDTHCVPLIIVQILTRKNSFWTFACRTVRKWLTSIDICKEGIYYRTPWRK